MAKHSGMGLLKVSSRSNPNAVAGAFAGVVREQGHVEVQVVGAGALNQAIKAVAIARSMLVAQGIELVCIPSFAEIEIDGEPRTALQLVVERRDRESTITPLIPAEIVPDIRLETSAGDLRVETSGLPATGEVLENAGTPVAPLPPTPAL